ncbi:hypothetical protein ABC383_22835 [Noviherbaspirillum sp. 1P10PC]|uniref:hypothetical protein n=1 Tax=Noviherbaspirillum sp. 1P10PC TaxID=3132292 RepID=UPI00399F1EF0
MNQHRLNNAGRFVGLGYTGNVHVSSTCQLLQPAIHSPCLMHSVMRVIEDWLEGSTFKRPVRYARLLTDAHSIPTDILPPLFEPVVVKMTANQMTLQRYQIGTRDGAAVHYMQSGPSA